MLNKYEGDVLVLEAWGSITDPKEFNPELFKKLFEMAVKEGRFEHIMIETHLTQIPESLVEEVSEINGGRKKIAFEVGLEDMDPENRKLINKLGVENTKLDEVYALLDKHGITLSTNLIYGFPFMNEQERIESVTSSVSKIADQYPNAEVILFLMSIKENTILEQLHNLGIYQMPNPWGLVETTRQIVDNDDIENLVTFSWFGEKENSVISEQLCYTCPECKPLLIDFFRNINGDFSPDERKRLIQELYAHADTLECRCHEKFKDQLQETDGKNPKQRYEDWLEEVGQYETFEQYLESEEQR